VVSRSKYPDAPSAYFSLLWIESMRQSMRPVAMTDIDTDRTKYGNTKLISPLAHSDPLGKDVWIMNMNPIASDPKYNRTGNATASVV